MTTADARSAVGAPVERAVRRILLGGRMLMPPALTEADARARIEALPTKDRAALRALVDWVEEYELFETRKP